ncbi:MULTISPECIES: hypothetical protein [Roseobacteraceae]|jgi:hypothetical protein|uniref:Uncharacterized protein n=1 Tax=Pseudosulfitobacter pseudonitzschiae TaxID=1402135 RepID=A0A221JY44_9RHOB|nr:MULTISPECIES: hypothetical protein [Roseobacteraceae]ASM71671.1 hypothetical protein SULPSESMR1_00840 [Pseudosulfitobacter pseudonitzschiae]
MMTRTLIFAALFAAPLAAEPMDADAFDAYTKGKTLFFGAGGAPYGAEVYLENRRVRWSFLDGDCKDGYWYEQAGNICFVYEDRPDPQCWTFEKRGGGLIAQFQNEPGSLSLYEAQDLGEEMLCLGPKIGV